MAIRWRWPERDVMYVKDNRALCSPGLPKPTGAQETPPVLDARHRMVGLGVYLAVVWPLAWAFLVALLLPLGTGMFALLHCVPGL